MNKYLLRVIVKRQYLKIENIPAILWGEASAKLFIAVHGNMSHKADDAIIIFAEEAIRSGYQVLSFDLPEHGDRKNKICPCKVQNCIQDLETVMRYAQSISGDINLFACSMGAYFSLLAYRRAILRMCLFLSPVVNMQCLIENMMKWFSITEERLKIEEEIPTPAGQILYWDYYCYVKEHPVVDWGIPTSILYGAGDALCESDIIASFSERFNCNLKILENGEHYFHTEEQLNFFRHWLKERLAFAA